MLNTGRPRSLLFLRSATMQVAPEALQHAQPGHQCHLTTVTYEVLHQTLRMWRKIALISRSFRVAENVL